MIWIVLIFLLFAITFSYGSLSAAPWVPMRRPDTKRVVQILNSLSRQVEINKKCVYELGCGDGRMLSVLSDAGYKSIGFEISLLPFVIALARKFFTRANYQIKYKSFWSASLVEADAIFFFLLPQIMPKLRAKLERELRPGTVVISYVWPIPDWAPLLIDEAPRAPKIFVYERS